MMLKTIRAKAIKFARNIKYYTYVQINERLKLHSLKKYIDSISHIKAVKTEKTKKNILFNTQYTWSYIGIEYMLASQLMQRGHQVKMLLCDGVPYCEQQTLTTDKPSCSTCFKRSERYAKTFGIAYFSISELLDKVNFEDSRMLAWQTPVHELRKLLIDQVELGEIAYRNLVHFYKGIYPIQGEVETQYRKIIEAAYLVLMATKRYMSEFNADIFVSANGKFVQSGVGVEYANSLGKTYITWEVFTQFSSTIFAKNSIALEQRLDDVWDDLKDIPLTLAQKNKLYKNFSEQAKSENTPFKYQESHYLAAHGELFQKYLLDPGKPIVTMFTNVEWDSTAMISSGFDGMLGWLCAGIDYAYSHPDIQLIVRAHPGELKVPYDLKTNTTICERLRDKYKKLPENVRLIDALEPVSSYALGEISEVVMVFSSTMGLEFALRKIKPWVAAATYYSEKGFTIDLKSKSHMYELLDQGLFREILSDIEHQYAERFAYIVRYRRLFSFPYFENSKFDFKRYQSKGVKIHPVIDNVCNLIDDDKNCLDLGETSW